MVNFWKVRVPSTSGKLVSGFSDLQAFKVYTFFWLYSQNARKRYILYYSCKKYYTANDGIRIWVSSNTNLNPTPLSSRQSLLYMYLYYLLHKYKRGNYVILSDDHGFIHACLMISPMRYSQR